MVDIMREILPMLPQYLETGIVTYSRHEDRTTGRVHWSYDRTRLVGDVEGDSTPPQLRVTIGRHPADAITFKIPDNIASPASWVILRNGVAGGAGRYASW
jgi:hypothetical protein